MKKIYKIRNVLHGKKASIKLYSEPHKSRLKVRRPGLSNSELQSLAGKKKSTLISLSFCKSSYFINMKEKIRWIYQFGRSSKILADLLIVLPR